MRCCCRKWQEQNRGCRVLSANAASMIRPAKREQGGGSAPADGASLASIGALGPLRDKVTKLLQVERAAVVRLAQIRAARKDDDAHWVHLYTLPLMMASRHTSSKAVPLAGYE